MRKLLYKIQWRLEMFEYTRLLKKLMVWCYIHFEGDQFKILNFFKQNQTVPERQLEEEMENVNLRDYLVFTQVERFDAYCKKHNLNLYQTLVVKKE